MAKVALKHLVRNKGRSRWVAKLRVPTELQPILRKVVFSQTTGETDPHRAAVKAEPILAKWRAEIEAARKGGQTTLQAEASRLRARYRAALRDNPEDAQDLLEEAIEEIFQGVGKHITPAQEHRAMEAHGYDRGAAIAALVPEVGEVIAQVRDLPTPFLEHVDGWLAQLKTRTQKQADEYERDVRAFGAGRAIDGLKGREVQAWIEGRLVAGDKVPTVQRRMSALRNYWGYLVRNDVAPSEGSPFDKRHYPRQTGDTPGARGDFTAQEVADLHAKAVADGDRALADLILLAAYTGARIEELCSLQVGGVSMSRDEIPLSLAIRGAKTPAGRRDIPVHSMAVPVVRRLTKDAQDGRWLIHSGADNKYDKRSTGLGKRFGRLKTALGHGEGLVFHSIRKTTATILQNANCPEAVAADILGHKIPTMTYGLYSTGSTMDTKRLWIERIVYPITPEVDPNGP
jgi:integrase